MAKLSTIVIMLMCLLLGFLAGYSTKTVAVMINKDTDKISQEQQQPKKTIVITFDESQQDEFFNQVKKFADKWAYSIRIAPTYPGSEVYLIQMWREDIKVIAGNNYGAGRFSMGFFETYPTHPVPDQYFNEEVSDLENFISEIPDATFSVEK